MGSTTTSPTTDNKLRWFRPTPAHLLVVLLMTEGILFLSQPWFPKGYAALIAIASVGVTMVLMLIWLRLALLFHWRFQFSLRSLMVATVAVAIPFSWLAVEMKRAREQRVAVEAIEEMGADVSFYQKNVLTLSRPRPGPVWLGKLLGDDFFSDIFGIALRNKRVTDTELEHLEGLISVGCLCLEHTDVTDTGLEHLDGLRNLRWLALCDTQVTDTGLKHLKGMPQLHQLFLDGTKVTDVGLEHLKTLTFLTDLTLRNTHVTDKGVSELQKALPNCDIQWNDKQNRRIDIDWQSR